MDIHIETQHFEMYDDLRDVVTSALEKLNGQATMTSSTPA